MRFASGSMIDRYRVDEVIGANLSTATAITQLFAFHATSLAIERLLLQLGHSSFQNFQRELFIPELIAAIDEDTDTSGFVHRTHR